MPSMTTLALTVPGGILDEHAAITLPSKTLSGLVALATGWPGETVFVTKALTTKPGPGHTRIQKKDLPFSVLTTDDRSTAIARLRPGMTLVSLTQQELPLIERLTNPYVVVAEFDAAGRRSVIQSTAKDGQISLRTRLGLQRLEQRFKRVVRRAAGLQANGPAAYEAYQGLTSSAMMYFDSRITAEMLSAPAAPPEREKSVLAFSGRWIPAKGFEHALTAFMAAYARSPRPLELQLFGDARGFTLPDHPGISVMGHYDFATQWVPHVATEVDYLLLPHRQPDPSCTYLEGAALGAPFLAYANEHAAFLAQRDLGAVTAMNDVDALADLIIESVTQPAAHARMAAAGHAFMTQQTFEREFSRRAAHLTECAGLATHQDKAEGA